MVRGKPTYITPIFRSLSVNALDNWISIPKKSILLHDRISIEHLSDLFITLPTRNGSRAPYVPPLHAAPLPYGHHLAFFHPRNPEHLLRDDGTDPDFCPPDPFTRRMWAGGKMKWNNHSPLLIGSNAKAVSTVAKVDKKNFDSPSPMIFVKQYIEYSSDSGIGIEEERSHVYLPASETKRGPRQVQGLPKPGFSFSYTPTLTTLFRFSALTFNGHYIHLDKDYAQKVEGYSERLVHGPLSALMLLETFTHHHPDRQLASFDYRAVNPLPVGLSVSIHGVWENEDNAKLWVMRNGDGVVVMTGNVTVR